MALKKKKTDEPKYATKNKRTKYSKNGVPFPVNDSLLKKKAESVCQCLEES